MRSNHLHICLYQPEIPQNTGAIGRLVAATANRLHIIRPTAFSLDDKQLLRPGLDYWPYLDLEIHDHLEDLLGQNDPKSIAFFSSKAQKTYLDMPTHVQLLVFGQETKGLPESLHRTFPDAFYTLPMFHPGVRSLNLAQAVAIACYHQMAQRGLFGPTPTEGPQGPEALSKSPS